MFDYAVAFVQQGGLAERIEGYLPTHLDTYLHTYPMPTYLLCKPT